MIDFKPPGCLSCVDALNEALRAKGHAMPLRNDQWRATIGRDTGIDPLMNGPVFQAAQEAVVLLQTEICAGAITACYVTADGLTNIRPGEAMTEEFTWALISGRVKGKEGKEVALYIRNQRSEAPKAPIKHRPKRLDLARDYWQVFPEGHQAAGRSKQQACGDIEAATDRQRVPESSLNDALTDYPTPQSLPLGVNQPASKRVTNKN